MNIHKIVTLSSAVALTFAVLDVPLAQARGGGGGGGGPSHSFPASSHSFVSTSARSMSRTSVAHPHHYTAPRAAKVKLTKTPTLKTTSKITSKSSVVRNTRT